MRRGFRRWQSWSWDWAPPPCCSWVAPCRGCGGSNDQPTKRFKSQRTSCRGSEGQTITAAAIRVRLEEASEQARDEELKRPKEEPRFDQREKLREQANKAHEIRISRIKDLANSFVELEQRRDSSPVLVEMTRILNEEKTDAVDKAIAYAERQRVALAGRCARSEAGRTGTESGGPPSALESRRAGTARGRPDAARAQFAELLELEPAWPRALESFAYFLYDQSLQTGYHGTLRAALDDAQRSFELAGRLFAQDKSRPESERVLSAASHQLGDLLVLRGQPGDADQALRHYTRGFEINEGLLKRNPEAAEAARDVSVSLNKLGDFLAGAVSLATPKRRCDTLRAASKSAKGS